MLKIWVCKTIWKGKFRSESGLFKKTIKDFKTITIAVQEFFVELFDLLSSQTKLISLN